MALDSPLFGVNDILNIVGTFFNDLVENNVIVSVKIFHFLVGLLQTPCNDLIGFGSAGAQSSLLL